MSFQGALFNNAPIHNDDEKIAFSEWKNSLNHYNFFCIHLRQKLSANLKSAKVVDVV